MKTIYLLISILLLPFIVFSQKPESEQPAKTSKGLFVDLMIGVTIPIGASYSSTDIIDEKAGFATTGYLFQGSLEWIGKKSLGIALQLTYQNNPISGKVKTDTLQGMFGPIGSGNWGNIYIMAGPVFLIKLKKIIIDVKATGGFIISSSPVFSLTNPETNQKESTTATGFALGLTAGAAYNISSHLALRVNLGYLTGFPSISKKYTVYELDPSINQYVYRTLADYNIKKTVSAINGGLGIIIII